MSKFFPYKKILLEKVYEKAKNHTTEKSFSGILKSLENALERDFKIQLSYKSLETYYKSIVQKNQDYNIKTLILNDLCQYLGFENFKEFCDKTPLHEKKSSVEVNILETNNSEDTVSEKFSKIIINITNQPIFTLPEFVRKHSNSFGLLGILLLSGFLYNSTNLFKDTKNNTPVISDSIVINKNAQNFVSYVPHKITAMPQTIVVPEKSTVVKTEQVIIQKKEKECMYWNGEEYIPVFCDEKIAGTIVEAIDENKQLLKKIKTPDTLTSENALGKVWYDKANHKVEFFTHYGINPENGKTLKPLTTYILEKYKLREE